VAVQTGDWIVADRDGVVVVPASQLDAIIDAGQAREAKEAGFFDSLRSGSTTVELLGLDASLVTVADEAN
jgi:4-hydroxy-4-methyl-2-oxoglutarate aldolase